MDAARTVAVLLMLLGACSAQLGSCGSPAPRRMLQQLNVKCGDDIKLCHKPVLLQSKAVLAGGSGAALSSWTNANDLCSGWEGVLCDADGNVQAITLNNAGLKGELPPSWGLLASLVEIQLKGNQLSGELPNSWSSLTSLLELHVDGNALSGNLPPSWRSLRALRVLNLASNLFSGDLPSQWTEMQELRSLDLSANNLSGDIPLSWGNLHITGMKLFDNPELSGCLPAGLLPNGLDLAGRGGQRVSFNAANALDLKPGPDGPLAGTRVEGWCDALQEASGRSARGRGATVQLAAVFPPAESGGAGRRR